MNSVSAIVELLSSPNLAAAAAALAQEPVAREALYRLGTLSRDRSLPAAELRQQDGGAGADAAAARVSMVRWWPPSPATSVLIAGSQSTSRRDARRHRRYSRRPRRCRRHVPLALQANRDALRGGALRRMANSSSTLTSQCRSCGGAVASLGVDASSAEGFLAAGWHLSLIGLLSSPSADVAASAAAVLGSLSSAPEFRHALMADGALQPILQPPHAPALPTRTAAVRALAIMSQQLMSTELPRGNASAAQLCRHLRLGRTPRAAQGARWRRRRAAAAAAARRRHRRPRRRRRRRRRRDAFARMLIAVLLLLQNLAGGYGGVRPRLVDGGAVGALLRFLSSHVAGDSGPPPAAAAASGGPRCSTPASTCRLVLTPAGAAALGRRGAPPRCCPSRVLGPSCRRLSAAPQQRAPDGAAAALAPCAAALLAVAASRLAAAVAVDALWALGSLHSLCRDAFAEGAAVSSPPSPSAPSLAAATASSPSPSSATAPSVRMAARSSQRRAPTPRFVTRAAPPSQAAAAVPSTSSSE